MPHLLHSSKDQIELKRLMGWSKNSLEKKIGNFSSVFSPAKMSMVWSWLNSHM
jgi:hypothetical protein